MSRKQFKMTAEQMERVLAASQPVPMLMMAGMLPSLAPSLAQDSANIAWQELARELGFVWDTARPVSGEGMDVFTAEVNDGE